MQNTRYKSSGEPLGDDRHHRRRAARAGRPEPCPPAGAEARRKKRRREGKGRPVDPAALAEVRALLGDEPRRRDLLIEHLHKIQDRYHAISAAHLDALAEEMRLAPAEVFEVATFYHHFDVVKEGEAAPPAVTVRVCDGLSCELAGAQNLLAMLRNGGYGDGRPRDHRAVRRPLRHRAGRGRQPESGRPRDRRGRRRGPRAQRARPRRCPRTRATTRTSQTAVTRCSKRASAGERSADDVIATMEDAGLRGLGGAGFPAGRKWKIVRAEPAPRLMAVNIDEGEPGTFKDRWYLERDPHRFLEGMLIAAWAVGIAEIYVYLRDEYARVPGDPHRRDRGAASARAGAAAADPSAPRRGRVHLRRRVGDDRVDRRQEGDAAAAPAVRRAGRRLRPPDARAQHGDAATGCARSSSAARRGSPRRGATAARGCARSRVSGRVVKPGVHLAPAGITMQELLDEYAGGMRAGPHVLRLLSRRRVGRHSAGVAGRHPARLRHAHQYGCFIGSAAIIVLSDKDTAQERGAQHAALLPRGVVRAVHAVPRRHGEGRRADGARRLGQRPAHRPVDRR